MRRLLIRTVRRLAPRCLFVSLVLAGTGTPVTAASVREGAGHAVSRTCDAARAVQAVTVREAEVPPGASGGGSGLVVTLPGAGTAGLGTGQRMAMAEPADDRPEPAAMALIALGLIGIGVLRTRFRAGVPGVEGVLTAEGAFPGDEDSAAQGRTS